MTWQQHQLSSTNHTDTSMNPSSLIRHVKKPIEIYVFIDPFSEVCWSLQTYLKKLMMEYGRFFTIRTIVSNHLSLLTNEKMNDVDQGKIEYYSTNESKSRYTVSHPWITSLAIKAAELQGKKAGESFLNRIQECLFLEKQNICDLEVLFDCAIDSKLDLQEFERDIFSNSAKKAYQCDLRLTNEMNVDHLPTMVFFNQIEEEHGIKVSGLYPYEIYELVLSEILRFQPIPSMKLPLEDFVNHYSALGTKELAMIYDWPIDKTKREMKKLQFKQKVEMVPNDYGSYWKSKPYN